MGLATFIGGIHPFEGKELSEDKPIQVLSSRYRARLLVLSAVPAHWRTCETTGSEGRSACLKGQIIAEAGGFISANVTQFCFRYSKGNRVQDWYGQWCNGSVHPRGE